jgi:hypothetical protein
VRYGNGCAEPESILYRCLIVLSEEKKREREIPWWKYVMYCDAPLLGCTVCHFASDNACALNRNQITIVELQLSILDDKGPHFVALSICVQVALMIGKEEDNGEVAKSSVLPFLYNSIVEPPHRTFRLLLAFTLLLRVSAIDRSNCVKTFIAKTGLI